MKLKSILTNTKNKYSIEGKMNKDHLTEKTLEEFRNTGLLYFVNSFLHIFGWCIVIDPTENKMYPARTDYRGFAEGLSDKAYKNIAAYMLKNSEEL